MKRRDFFRGLAAIAIMAPAITAAKAETSNVPFVHTPPEEIFDWAEEVRRCKEGYTPPGCEYISGYAYFFLNYCTIARYDRSGGYSYGKPDFRQRDVKLLNELWKDRGIRGVDREQSAHHFNFPRGYGWSCIVASGLMPYNSLFEEGNSYLVSCNSAAVEYEMHLIQVTLKNIPHELRSEIGPSKNGANIVVFDPRAFQDKFPRNITPPAQDIFISSINQIDPRYDPLHEIGAFGKDKWKRVITAGTWKKHEYSFK